MAFEVTSWFQDQIEKKTVAPKKVFMIGNSDYSGYVIKWPTIKNSWNDVRTQNVSMALANNDQTFVFIKSDKTAMQNECKLKLGFTHPTSGDELIDLFTGTIGKVSYNNGKCNMTLSDKFKQLSERVMGTRDAPVTFTNSSSPPDIAWAAITSYGGYSSIESDSNPDINYQSYLDWAAVFSADNVFMNGNIQGKKCNEVLKKISRYTESAIYVSENKFNFKRFTAADSNQSSFDNDTIIDLSLSVDDEDIINKQYVYAAYDVDSRDWFVQTFDVSTSSINSYGIHEQIEKDESIWYVNSVSAVTLAQKRIALAGEPYDRIIVTTPLFGALRQIGETITVVDSTMSIDGGYRVMQNKINLDTGLYEADVDRTQYLQPFTLDVSKLDGEDVLL